MMRVTFITSGLCSVWKLVSKSRQKYWKESHGMEIDSGNLRRISSGQSGLPKSFVLFVDSSSPSSQSIQVVTAEDLDNSEQTWHQHFGPYPFDRINTALKEKDEFFRN